MTTKLTINDKNDLVPVEIWWSKTYGCPIYKVGYQFYIEDTDEYAGYFDEAVIDLVTTDSSQDTVTPSRPGEHKKQELEGSQ